MMINASSIASVVDSMTTTAVTTVAVVTTNTAIANAAATAVGDRYDNSG